MKTISQSYGPWAIVTGASRGLGSAFADELASHGINLVLTARNSAKLDELKAEITQKHKVDVRCVPLDLSDAQAPAQLLEACADVDVGLLVNNAGIYPKGHFEDMPLEELLTTVRLNCSAPLELTHRILQRLKKRKRSGIIFVSSIQAFQAVPYMANYSGTKAYNYLLGQGLWYEFKPMGIDVLVATPGFINQRGRKAGIGSTDPEPIARDALRRLGKRLFITTGLFNKLAFYGIPRFLPVPVSLRVLAAAAVIRKSMPRRRKKPAE